jgi:preprotein translocase subunit YajC
VIAASSSGSGFIFIVVIAVLVVWLLFVRPQRKKQTEAQKMVSELRVGDEVLTAGGIYGTILAIDDDEIMVEIAPQTQVRVARRAIAGVMTEPEPELGAEESDEPEAPAAEAENAEEPPAQDVDTGGPIEAAEPSDAEERG